MLTERRMRSMLADAGFSISDPSYLDARWIKWARLVAAAELDLAAKQNVIHCHCLPAKLGELGPHAAWAQGARDMDRELRKRAKALRKAAGDE